MSEVDGDQGWWTLRADPGIQEETKSKAPHGKSILKSNENLIKQECNRNLKKKLKKYRLKRRGQEDPAVLDVSEALHQSLKIKSPRKFVKGDHSQDIFNIARPENYIIKMVRRKQLLLKKNGEVDGSKRKSKTHSQAEQTDNSIPVKNITEMKKETNAFLLMMDSRNKSIGGNSPGKEFTVNEEDIEIITEKKLIKVKRTLALEKMAEAKGSIKIKEMEDLKEECIKVKMEKRADRLKKMITKGTKKKRKKEKAPKNEEPKSKEEKKKPRFIKDAGVIFLPDTDQDKDNEKNHFDKDESSRSVKINGITSKLNGKDKFTSPEMKIISKEDEDFLSKLSPSIRKKDNMLSYFKKIEKVTETDVLSDDEKLNGKNDDSQSIKVKFTKKNKKKSKKNKLSLLKNANILEVDCNETTGAIETPEIDTSRVENDENPEKCTRKRKRRDKLVSNILSDNTDLVNTDPMETSIAERRPKRIVRQPVKYIDDVQLSSSDEELHVFTPKKKKHLEIKDDVKCNTIPVSRDQKVKEKIVKILNKTTKLKNKSQPGDDDLVVVEEDDSDTKTTKHEEKLKNKTGAKLAPIFKSKIDPAIIEAKQKFLQSGMPEQLKKVVAQQKAQSFMMENFTSVVHIHQNVSTPTVTLQNEELFYAIEGELDAEEDIVFNGIDTKSIFGTFETKETRSHLNKKFETIDVKATLQTIKDSYPEFPVYRTYKTLNNKRNGDQKNSNPLNFDYSAEVLNDLTDSKNEDPNSLSWTDKYRATSTNQIIGNFDSVKELKTWLVSWKENENISAANGNDDSDSDFCQSDTDSRDSMRISNNLFVLTGPPGTGKTSCVYAVAAELSMKVIEVNVSSKRTGRILLQDLQEATQSHKVNRNKGSSAENSQNSQELFSKRPQGFKKQYINKKLSKSNSDTGIFSRRSNSLSQSQSPEGGTGMSLILIDDADIVFDQDDGFISGIAQLVQCSKRPVILVTSTLTCPHLQKFLLCGKIVKMNPLSPRMLGTWLDVMCLVDTAVCWPGMGAQFLDYFKGDMRKTINCLQFYVYTEAQKRKAGCAKVVERNCDIDIDEENSNMSWVEIEDKIETKTSHIQTGVWQHFAANPSNMLNVDFPQDLLSVWWNVPHILNFHDSFENSEQTSESNEKSYKRLEDISAVFDNISLADSLGGHIVSDARRDICADPWQFSEADSVSETANLDEVDNNCQVSKDIAYDLVKRSLDSARGARRTQDMDLRFPSSKDRRKRDKTLQRHDVLTESFCPSAALGRRALALDYWAACRALCRLERENTHRTAHTTRTARRSRFCHYLRSCRVTCKDHVFEKLCDSLQSVDETGH